jgi:UDP-N-acetyl-D-glucosamine dehydrogenase
MIAEQTPTDQRSAVAVVGLGYVGLPLATAFAKAGLRVVGVDPDERKVAAILRGESYIRDIPSEDLASLVGAPSAGRGQLTATVDYAAIEACDGIFICVPTPFDSYKTPDLSYVVSAAERIAEHLRPGHIVVLQSTTFPGTTEEVVQPILERTGLRAGNDFHLAFSPERIDPGNSQWNAENLPKIVGGVGPRDAEVAAELLRRINPNVHVVSSTRAAEMTKLLENIFRSVNIALVNELALLAERMDIDIWEVIQAAATKPFGFLPFYPGPGVGGHCIPVDPYYLSWKAREFDFTTRFIELAAETNQRMPYHVVEIVGRALGGSGKGLHGARVLVMGTAFKADVEDARNSPAERVMELLLDRGCDVVYHDPFVPRFEIKPSAFYSGQHLSLESQPLRDEAIAGVDCVLILVHHSDIDYERIVRLAPLVVDTVNAIGSEAGTSVVRLGAGWGAGAGKLVEPAPSS